jgi:Fe-S cluster biosynthesis and repair protein YggX
MARMVFCQKLKRELPGLEFRPWPTPLGQRIYDQISQDAWRMWTEYFKMVMNEYRLVGGSPETNRILFEQAEKFLFADSAEAPPDYKPPPVP